MPDRLHFTDIDEANVMIATDPLALLVGFVLDQQVSVQKAFAGPLVLKERLGAFDADTLAAADLEPVFRERPALHRYPGSMSKRVHDLAVHLRSATTATPSGSGPRRPTPPSYARTWPPCRASAR